MVILQTKHLIYLPSLQYIAAGIQNPDDKLFFIFDKEAHYFILLHHLELQHPLCI